MESFRASPGLVCPHAGACPAFKIDLRPLKLANLTKTATGPVAHDEHGAFIYGQRVPALFLLGVFPEPVARVLFLLQKLGKVRHAGRTDLVVDAAQLEGPRSSASSRLMLATAAPSSFRWRMEAKTVGTFTLIARNWFAPLQGSDRAGLSAGGATVLSAAELQAASFRSFPLRSAAD